MGADRVSRLVLLAAAVLAAGAAAPAGTPAAPPPPGDPPDAGLPAPPGSPSPAGQVPPAVTVPIHPRAPNVIDTRARLARGARHVRFGISCRANGRARLRAPRLGSGVLAVAAYRCRGRRATATLRLPRSAARRLAGVRRARGRLTLRQGRTTVSADVTLLARGARPGETPPGVWTDGSLQCSPTGGPEAYLVAPNWTAAPATPISVRPWVAVYGAATGWRWIGVDGERASRWLAFTATPEGVAEWRQPDGVLVPWTWGPIRMPTGRDTEAIGLFEVVYWWSGGPRYVARQVRPGGTASGACRYP
jgi:hypothetical protein